MSNEEYEVAFRFKRKNINDRMVNIMAMEIMDEMDAKIFDVLNNLVTNGETKKNLINKI
jgi:ribosomal protein L22